MQLGMMRHIPDEIVPVASLDPLFPLSAQQGVHFSSEQIGQGIDAHGKGNGIEQIRDFGFKSAGRIGIDFQFDFHLLPLGQFAHDVFLRFDNQELFDRIRFEKCRLYGTRGALAFCFGPNIKAKCAHLSLQGIAIPAQIEIL